MQASFLFKMFMTVSLTVLIACTFVAIQEEIEAGKTLGQNVSLLRVVLWSSFTGGVMVIVQLWTL